jgi:hypothetical protein
MLGGRFRRIEVPDIISEHGLDERELALVRRFQNFARIEIFMLIAILLVVVGVIVN